MRHRGSAVVRSWLVRVLFLALLLVFIGVDLRRNRDWQSDYTIWAVTAIQQPDSPLARVNLGALLQADGKYPAAVKEYEKAIEIFEGYNLSFSGSADEGRRPSRMTRGLYASAFSNLGGAYMKLRRYEDAVPKLKTALTIDSSLYGALCNLGTAYINLGRLDEAIEALVRAIAINDRYPDAHIALAHAYEKKGMYTEAQREREMATLMSKSRAK